MNKQFCCTQRLPMTPMHLHSYTISLQYAFRLQTTFACNAHMHNASAKWTVFYWPEWASGFNTKNSLLPETSMGKRRLVDNRFVLGWRNLGASWCWRESPRKDASGWQPVIWRHPWAWCHSTYIFTFCMHIDHHRPSKSSKVHHDNNWCLNESYTLGT